MIMDRIVKTVSDQMPRFNRDLLVEHDKMQIDSSRKFIDTCFQWMIKIVNSPDLIYKGCRVATPEERSDYEIGVKSSNKGNKPLMMILSELQLVIFTFDHKNSGTNKFGNRDTVKNVYLYVPYIWQNMIHINGRRLSIIKGIVEKIFCKMDTKQIDVYKTRKGTRKREIVDTNVIDGIMIRPIRARLAFNRIKTLELRTHDGRQISHEYIISAKLHLKKHRKRKVETTIIHYLLCKFGFVKTLNLFNISQDDFILSNDILDQEKFTTFDVLDKKDNMIYLNVKHELLNIELYRRFICNLLYILNGFNIYTVDDLYDPSGSMYRVMLGLIINPGDSFAKAKADMDTHIDSSVEYYIDPIFRERLRRFNIPATNIYELLIYIFSNISELVANCSTQNLFEKRIDITDGILTKAYAEKIFSNIYEHKQRSVLKPNELKRMLKILPMAIKGAFNQTRKTNGIRNINNNPQIYGDNWLISCGGFKTRHLGNGNQKFHPSIPVVESITSYSGKEVGKVGYINPFAPIDRYGVIITPDYAKEVNKIYEP